MTINPDCIRVIMLYLEANHKYGTNLHLYDLLTANLVSSFTREDIEYSLVQLHKENMLDCKIRKGIDGTLSVTIVDIQPAGHKFCDKIKDESIWNKAKPILEKVTTIAEISTAITTFITSLAAIGH